MAAHIDVVVHSIERLGRDVCAIDLVATDGAPLPLFGAGAHIEVFIRPNLIRPYSLCNTPSERHRYRIGVLRDPKSRGGSQVIFTQWVVGMPIRISAPRNLFPLERQAGRSVLIAGGIGVTPLMAMAHTLAASKSPFELHYCVREREKAAFLEELQGAGLGKSLRPHFSVERRFDMAADVRTAGKTDHLYVCGPQGFMDHVIEEARQLGWSDSQIHFEYFDAETDLSGGAFRVQLASGGEFEIPAGRSIADVLIEHGYTRTCS